jgi:POT family proton-dependent oligopeptide transporter
MNSDIRTIQDSKKDQSKVLAISCITEFGERYSYYLLQSLLILFLTNHFKLNAKISSSLVGSVLGMIYISAIIGGVVADKLLGYYRSAFIGTAIMIIGSSILAISDSISGVYLGLCFVSVSTGLIKSNISSFIGRFYDRSGLSEANRDFGFNIFYVGINIGAFTSQFVASSLANKFGYHIAFSSSILASILMLLNMLVGFFILKSYISSDIKVTTSKVAKAAAIIIAYMGLVYLVLNYNTLADIAVFASVAVAIIILWRAAQASKGYKRIITASMFFILSTMYWILYFQLFISIELFVEIVVKKTIFSIPVSTTQVISTESVAILIMGYFMGRFWIYREKIGKAVHDIDKFDAAFVLLTIMFILFYLAIATIPGEIPATVMAALFFIMAISELCLSAIGLSMVTKLAPQGFVSLFMSIWLVTLGVGGKIAGFISSNIKITANNIAASKVSMQHGILVFIAISIAASIICLLYRKQAIAQDEMHRILKR